MDGSSASLQMDNNLDGSTLTIDLNSNPIQNPNETPKLGFEETSSVAEMKSLFFKDDQAEGDELMEELSRVKSENKRLTDLLTMVSRNFCDIKQQRKCEETRKRKSSADDDDDDINQNLEFYSGGIGMPNLTRSNISRVYVRIDPSDVSLVVRDGYRWRKYGQKVTRDNPSPRAYYKCSFAPACPVKKKVQRSVDDPTLLVAMYEGKHDHHHHHGGGLAPADASPPGVSSPGRPICGSGGSTTTTSNEEYCSKIEREIATNEIQQFLVDKMASSLTRNPGFTAALAAAITGRIFDESENSAVDHINVSNSAAASSL